MSCLKPLFISLYTSSLISPQQLMLTTLFDTFSSLRLPCLLHLFSPVLYQLVFLSLLGLFLLYQTPDAGVPRVLYFCQHFLPRGVYLGMVLFNITQTPKSRFPNLCIQHWSFPEDSGLVLPSDFLISANSNPHPAADQRAILSLQLPVGSAGFTSEVSEGCPVVGPKVNQDMPSLPASFL